jgi:hypothetical protein
LLLPEPAHTLHQHERSSLGDAARSALAEIDNAVGVELEVIGLVRSGITSASTASRALAANTAHVLGFNLAGDIGITVIGLAFMALVAIVNFRGSAKA